MQKEILIKSEFLSSVAGCHVFYKEEFHGPTGSYKDRIAPVIIEEAIKVGARGVVVSSSGNFGLAVAEAAKQKNIACVVLGLMDMLPFYKDEIVARDATLEFFSNTEESYRRLDEYRNQGYFLASIPFEDRTQKDAPGTTGYIAISEEIVSTLGVVPDFVILPTCYGDGAKALLQGFAGLNSKPPQFVLVRNKETEDDIVYSISTNETTPQVEYVLENSNGIDLYLSEKDFVEGQAVLREKDTQNVEVSSGGVVPALKRLAEAGTFSKTDTVVVILTAIQRTSPVSNP